MIRNVPVDQISVSEARRPPRDVESLAESIREIGLLHPITVTSSLRLVAGGRRLAAFRLLGRPEIPANVVELDDLDAELAEIEENLIRNELTVLERGEQLARRKEIYEAKHPETKQGGDRRREAAKSGRNDFGLKSFAADAASRIGTSPRTVHQEIQVAKQIAPDAKQLIRGTGLEDHKVELMNLARVDAEKQAAVVGAILAGRCKTVAQARRAVERDEKREAMGRGAGEAPPVEGDRWRIIAGDCLEVLRSIAPGSARLVFADPPYNEGIPYGDHYDDDLPPQAYLEKAECWLWCCHQALTPDGSLWLLINHEWAWQLCGLAVELGFKLRQWITWFESFGVNCTGKFNRCSRALLWLVKDPRHFVFHGEAVTRPSDRQAKYGDRRANSEGKLWDDVWGINPPIPRLTGSCAERLPDFPTQLPLALLLPIVACASDPGDLVIDPFAGSATTGEAAIRLGRRFWGIELGDTFAEMARMRLMEVCSGSGTGPSPASASGGTAGGDY
jgi:DNA modification methylase